MTTTPGLCPPDPGPLLASAVTALAEATGLPVTFGGPVASDGRDLVISHLHGTATRSLRQLRVAAGAGLGGKALALARPAAVEDYLRSESITHRYDQAVAPERLCTIVALPVRGGRGPRSATRAVLYAAVRQTVPLGDRVLRAAMGVVRQFERDWAVEQEVHRRLATQALADPGSDGGLVLSAREAGELRDELLAIAGTVDNAATRDRLLAVCQRFPQPAGADPAPAGPRLSPREVQLLAQVAAGGTNNDIAAALGLLPNTVKTYLKHAMRKLGVTNRIQAVNRARRLGLID